MRNAGGNVTIITLFQAYHNLIVHAIPHPSALSGCHLPPGEGFIWRILRQLSSRKTKTAPHCCGAVRYRKTSISGRVSLVIDLLNVADIHVVQHVTALGQHTGKASEEIQHDRSPFDKSLLIYPGISYRAIMNKL